MATTVGGISDVRQAQSKERPIPLMRVVTKGWWTLKEERVPVEALEEMDRQEREQD